MARPGPGRTALGLSLCAAVGLGLGLLWALRRRRRGWSWGAAGSGHGDAQAVGRLRQALPRVPVPVEAGGCAVLTHVEQVDVLDRLDLVLTNISELRKEVEELRNSLQHLAADIVGDVRSHLEETQRVARRRRFPFHRERSDSTGSSSIYFTANSGATNTDDGESEGGYTTANAESDYDRESEKESEEGEDELSCETVRTARRDSLDLVNEDETHLILDSSLDEGLGQVLLEADRLHDGDEQEKREGFQLLLNNKLAYADQGDFLWRLARAHSDMYDITEDTDEKKSYASDDCRPLKERGEVGQTRSKAVKRIRAKLFSQRAEREIFTACECASKRGESMLTGKEELEIAFQKWDQSAECHQWYAILCGQLAEHESIQKRIQTGYIFKEHVDKAIALKPEDPRSYYLLGRWCYQVSHLGWLEKKTASALFETPPTATVQDALQNFLKVEELSPGFSKAVRVYIAKCYKDLGNNSAALLWMNLASELPVNTKEDSETERELEEMRSVWEE